MEIIIDDSGLRAFVDLIRNKNYELENIKKCLDTSGYHKLIKLGGPNIGMPKEEEWIDVFVRH